MKDREYYPQRMTIPLNRELIDAVDAYVETHDVEDVRQLMADLARDGLRYREQQRENEA